MKLLNLLKRTQASIIRSEYVELQLSMMQAEHIAKNYRENIQKINNENQHLSKLTRLNPRSIEYSILNHVVRQWGEEEWKKRELSASKIN